MTTMPSRGPRTAAALALTGLLGVGVAVAAEVEPSAIDTTKAVRDPVPWQTTDARSQVLVLALDVERGSVRSAEVVSSEVAPGAPDVLARAAGEWQVRVEAGELSYEFATSDPTWREAEADTRSGYQWVPLTGSLEWPLVLPLTVDGVRADGVDTVSVTDTGTGEVVLEVQP